MPNTIPNTMPNTRQATELDQHDATTNKPPTQHWIDIGINLADNAFDKDLETVIAQAKVVGVDPMIITGTDVVTSQKAQRIASEYGLFSTAGIHPHHAHKASTECFDQLQQLYQLERVVAVGETGLDFCRDFSPQAQQQAVFEHHLQLGIETKLPLFFHQRDAHKRFLPMVKEHRDRIQRGVVHCFTGNQSELFDYLDLDLYIGITGWICDERRGTDLKALVHNIPLQRLMIETDGPYLLPRDLLPKPKSRRNEPKYLPHIAAVIAECYNISLDELAEILMQNTRAFFNLTLPPQ